MDIAALIMFSVLLFTAAFAVGLEAPMLGILVVALGVWVVVAFRNARKRREQQ